MPGAYDLLHPLLQRKLYEMRWTELRPIQRDAILHLLGPTPTDCLITSPTASGKTEAAFLPVISAIADDWSGSVRAMYIGPLKALINDQFGRIEELCTRIELPVCRWHGDVDDGPRKALLARPGGILLITPESLEAMFVLRPTQMKTLFGRLSYVVIDEVHAFLGTERGAQLISQLHRLGLRAGVDPLRIGLSATIGDYAAARRWLRRHGRPVHTVESPLGDSEIRILVKGLWRQKPEQPDDDPVIA
jgi:ATP-dependent Lhr-like helicase